MDLLSLLNSAVNFIIYCAMSRKFRCVFLQIIFSCLPRAIHRLEMNNVGLMKELQEIFTRLVRAQ